jgi:hypothetical protein
MKAPNFVEGICMDSSNENNLFYLQPQPRDAFQDRIASFDVLRLEKL